MRKRITQVDAAKWKHRALEAECELRTLHSYWLKEDPSMISIGEAVLAPELTASIRTARRLGFPVVVATRGDAATYFFATKTSGTEAHLQGSFPS